MSRISQYLAGRFDQLYEALEMALTRSGARGGMLYDHSIRNQIDILMSAPKGLHGRRYAVSQEFAAIPCNALLSSDEVLLPIGLTTWLGWRPRWLLHCRVAPHDAVSFMLFWPLADAAPETPGTGCVACVEEISEPVAEFQVAIQAHRLQSHLDVLLGRVNIGVVFQDSGKGTSLNQVAARILDVPSETTDSAVIANAIQHLRNNSQIKFASSSIPMTESLLDISGQDEELQYADKRDCSEYWISSDGISAYQVDSHEYGNDPYPQRLWIFNDIRTIWGYARDFVRLNAQLEVSLKRLAAEIKRRRDTEAELARMNARLQERNEALKSERNAIEALARSDELTGVPNRRFLKERLDTELRGGSQIRGTISLLMIDIDRFKMFNDRYGHLAGDDCLLNVAQALRRCLKRERDFVARYGGEEFVIVLPGTDLEGARRVAGRVADLVRDLAIPHLDSHTGYLTVSIGIACSLTTLEIKAERLLKEADEALYAAKAEGRNAIRVYALIP